MKTKLTVGVAAAFLILGMAGVALVAQDREDQEVQSQDRASVDPKHFVVQSLGTSSSATDVWSVQCALGTGRVRADVNDNGGVDGIRMIVTIVDPAGRAISRTSPDNGIASPIVLSARPGNYLVLISKTAASFFAEAYDSIIDCQTATGGAVAHNVVLVQNQ